MKMNGCQVEKDVSARCGCHCAQVSWPRSLVVGPAALAVYQLLGRHLLGMNRAEHALNSAWAAMQAVKRGVPAARYQSLTPAHALCRLQSYVLQVGACTCAVWYAVRPLAWFKSAPTGPHSVV